MRARAVLVLVVLVLVHVDGQRRRRVRSTTAAPTTTTTTTFVGRQFGFAGQPEELETLWDNFDIQRLDGRSDTWKSPNGTLVGNSFGIARQYPGLPTNPGDSNELPNPISPPALPDPPPPQPAPGCLGMRGQYPSPKSCDKYLNCWDDVVVEQTCPDGLLFNDVTNVCDYPANVDCGSRPPATPKPPLPPGSRSCPDPNGRYRSSTNCSEFYVCVSGKPIKFCCPRRLVYNDILDVCDYPYNVDCKGSATPKPDPPPPPHTHPTQPPTYPPPTQPTQPPTQAPSYVPHPTYPPQQPSYQPQPYPPPVYPGNPWLSKVETDPWHQRPPASQIEIEKERIKPEESPDNQSLADQPPQDVTETSSLLNPWSLFQVVPAELTQGACNNGDVHRLNEACTNVVVCRNNRPQLVRCPTGYSFDKPSDSCRPFSIAKC